MSDFFSTIWCHLPSSETTLKVLQGLFYILSVAVSSVALYTARRSLEHSKLMAEQDRPRVNVVTGIGDDTNDNGTGQCSLIVYNDGQRPTSVTTIRVSKPDTSAYSIGIPKDEGRLEPGGYYAQMFKAADLDDYWSSVDELEECLFEVQDVTGKWHKVEASELIDL